MNFIFKKTLPFLIGSFITVFIAEVICFFLFKNDITFPKLLHKIPYNNSDTPEQIIKPNFELTLPKQTIPTNIKSADIDYSQAYKLSMLSNFYHKPNNSQRAILTAKNKTLYDVVYNIDSFSRRKTLTHENKKEFLLTFGGSHVFGEGVNDNETIPSYITKYSSYFQAYNFGSQGAAINNLLLNLKNKKNYQSGVKQKNGRILYVFYGYHFKRLFSQFNISKKQLDKKSAGNYLVSEPATLLYDKSNNYLRHTSYSEANPFKFWFKNKLAHSNIIRFFQFGLPLRWGTKHFKYLEQMLNDLSKDCTQHFGPNKVHLLLAHYFKPQLRQRIKTYFNGTNIGVIDLHDLGFGDQYLYHIGRERFFIPGDGHPNSFHNDVLGRILAEKFDSLSSE